MRNSNYNVEVQIRDDSFLIYNTLNQTMLTLNASDLVALDNGSYTSFTDEEIALMLANGVLIEDDCNELKIYEYKRHLAQFNFKKLHILYTITSACNSNCEYCFQKNNAPVAITQSKKNSIRAFIIQQALKQRCRVVQIDFFGGEPFVVYRQVIEEIEFFNKWFGDNDIIVQYRFYTNGTIMNGELLNCLVENKSKIKDLQITLDGPKEVHDAVRPLKRHASSYDAIMNNLKLLHAHGIPVQLRINFNATNYKNVSKCLDDLQANGIKDIPIFFYAVQAMSAACSHYELAITDEDTLKVFPELWTDAILRKANINLQPSPGFVYCSASCMSTFVVNYLGEVYKCALLQTDKKYKIGNILEDGELSNVSSAYYTWMCKTPLAYKKCRSCKLLPVCGGGCSGSAAEKFNNFDHENCFDMNMDLFKARLKLYYLQKYG